MTGQQFFLQTPGVDQFNPDVRCAALRLLANAGGSAEYLPAAADDTITHKQSQLSDILQLLARFGYEAARKLHDLNGDLAARFIGDELEIAEFADLLDHLERGRE